jgi:hypothetical protein
MPSMRMASFLLPHWMLESSFEMYSPMLELLCAECELETLEAQEEVGKTEGLGHLIPSRGGQ